MRSHASGTIAAALGAAFLFGDAPARAQAPRAGVACVLASGAAFETVAPGSNA
jgi:hypothetical protein